MQRIRTNARRRRIIFEVGMIALLIALVVADQVTKICVKNLHDNTSWESTTVINNFFYFTYVVNTGSAWSFLSGVAWAQTFFKVITGVALVGFSIYYYFVTKKQYKWLKVALVLLIAGTIGNFIDRLIYNGVIDFISFVFGSYHFPVFNLADSFMTVGIIMLIIHYLFLDKNALFKKSDKTKKQEKTENSTTGEQTVLEEETDLNESKDEDADKTV